MKRPREVTPKYWHDKLASALIAVAALGILWAATLIWQSLGW